MFCALALWLVADVHFALEASTNAPVDIGGRLSIDLPPGLELSTELGVMPSFYSGAINAAAVGLHLYSAAQGAVVSQGLSSSLVWRTHVGYRPFDTLGLYVAAGYGLVTLGGGVGLPDLLRLISPGTIVPIVGDPSALAKLTMHMIDVEVGYRFVLFDQLVIRVALGGAFTVEAASQIYSDNPLVNAAQLFRDKASQYEATLNRYLRAFGFVPTLTIGVGYRFF